jgi:hypothetical protein
MGVFLLYGLDRRGAVQGSEHLAGIIYADAERIAYERLEIYEIVEVWEGPIRVLKLDRRPHSPG